MCLKTEYSNPELETLERFEDQDIPESMNKQQA
jgi:hypothetical protein